MVFPLTPKCQYCRCRLHADDKQRVANIGNVIQCCIAGEATLIKSAESCFLCSMDKHLST